MRFQCSFDACILQRLGDGTYGAVVEATHEESGQRIAMKQIDRRYLYSVNEREAVKREAEFLMDIKHVHIVRLLTKHETISKIIFIQELCRGGTLKSLIQKRRLVISEQECRVIFRQIASGLDFIHNKRLVHGDIKPENILFADDIVEKGNVLVKLCDFGSARRVEESGSVSFREGEGSLSYLAPERMKRLDYDFKVDSWSLGIMLHECLFGFHPFFPIEAALIPVEELSFDPKYTDHISSTAKDLVKKLLIQDPVKRLSISDFLSHSWFA